jgi:hypothetical protein
MAETPQDYWGGVWGQGQQQQPWGGFNADNVFSSWDLNPLSQQTGIGRDDLANQRDAYLQPLMQQYRTGAGQGGADAGDQDLYADPNFQSFARTGQLPKNATPAQQWNAAPSSPGPAGGTGDALMQQLMQRATQGAAPSRTDPTIRAQADAYAANEGRSSRNYIADLAEKSAGAPVNLQGEQRMAAERMGQRTGAFEAELLGRETDARRQEISEALQMWGGMFSNEQRMALERELAQLSNTARTQDRSQQNDQFMRELALREFDTNQKWDFNWLTGGV